MFKNLLRIFVILVGFIFLLTPFSSQAAIPGSEGVTVSPPLTELTINKGETAKGIIKLTNPLAKIIELYTSTADFLPEGETGGQKFLAPIAENRKFSAASWINVEQSKIAMTPEEVEEIGYTISVPKDAEPCGHYAVIFFNSQPPELEKDKSQVAIGSQVGALFLINVPEAKEGECSPSGVAETFTAPWLNLKMPVNFLTRIYNNGLVHFKPIGEIKIKNWGGTVIDGIKFNEGGGNVLPQSARRFDNKWEAKDFKWWQKIGRFKAELGLVYGQTGALKSLSSSVVFWVIPWWIFVILGLIIIFIIWLIVKWRKKKKHLESFQLKYKNGQRPILR